MSKKKECDSCGSEVLKLHKVTRRYPEEEGLLCDVCYSTYCGHAYLYPGNKHDGRIILATIAQCTNMILKVIRDKTDRE